ncbi:salt tolerance down-regulator-domain-containing protein [Mycena crocata]|nr:salt tolerance down-regulator-domain-containing protein [Mycena crocata]
MAPPPPPPPSSVSIGKKPMAYQQTQAPPAPRSARAQAKAPVAATYPDSGKPGFADGKKPAAGAANATPGANNPNANNNKIWSTSSIEQRERIRDFWLALGEDERRDLVRVEKDTVLRKMKEQQKHSCSCAVCGRKRCVLVFRCPTPHPSLLVLHLYPLLPLVHRLSPFLYVLIHTSATQSRRSSKCSTTRTTRTSSSTRSTSSSTSPPIAPSPRRPDPARSPGASKSTATAPSSPVL